MTSHARSTVSKAKTLVVNTIQAWVKHDATSRSAALAFYTLFSLAPILVLIVSIAGVFIGGGRAESEVFSQVKHALGSAFSDGIQQLLQAAMASGQGSKANVIAIGVLLVGSTSVFTELKDSLDAVWELPPTEGSGVVQFLRTKVLSFGLLLSLSFLLIVSLVVSTALDAFSQFWIERWPTATLVLRPVSHAVAFLVIVALFSLIYKMLPQKHLAWSDVFVGAGSSAVLFTLGKFVISAYLSKGTLGTVYGAAGSVVVLTSWIYYSALVFFLGAEFTRQYAQLFGSDSKNLPARPPPAPERPHYPTLPPHPLGT